MSTTQPIILYDVPANVEFIPTKAFSPNVWKVRLALNYKRIPYRTEWVEYPDIAETCKKAGIPASATKPDGTKYYSVPSMVDPSTGAAISQSDLIVDYLDKQYPDTPKLFPDGTRALQYAFYEVFEKKMWSLAPMCVPTAVKKANPASQAYLYPAREKLFGKTMEELYPVGDALVQAWAKVREGFDTVNGWFEKGATDGPYLLGKEPCFCDFVVAGWVLFIKLLFGENGDEWKEVSQWNDGRWAGIIQRFQEYQAVV